MSTIIAQPYNTAGNGGRKLVRLSNGWLVAAVKDTSNNLLRFYKSIDSGNTWSEIHKRTFSPTPSDMSIVSNGNTVHVVVGYSTAIYTFKFDATTIQLNDTPSLVLADQNQVTIGNVSLAIDPTNGHLHAAWASKNASYPNSFNIRYAKSTDGGVAWSAVEQVTVRNVSGSDYLEPSIVVRNGVAYVFNMQRQSGGHSLFVWESFSKTTRLVFSGGSYVQIHPSAVVDKVGVIHVAWTTGGEADSKVRICYSKSIDSGVTWSTREVLDTNTSGLTTPSITVDKNNKVFISYSYLNISGNNTWNVYIISKSYNGSWVSPLNITNATSSQHRQHPSTLFDATFTGQFGEIPPIIYQAPSAVEYIGTYTLNNAPNVTLTSPSNNQTLYENDTINISGEAYDADKDQSVTTYYQINSEQRKVLATNLSQTQINLSKQLTFKGGKLYDGDTALTGTLADGVAHTLKVWAEDSEKAQSTVETRTFYVVANRAPILTVNNPTPSGVIDSDSFTITGTFSDPDGNVTTVVYRINGGNSIQIAQGISGDFTFDITLGSLQIGANAIAIEATDSYGAKTTKTVKLNKSKIATPITRSTVRYKVAPPSGTASEILVWVQHDANLTLDASVSMTLSGEAESFTTMTKNSTTTLPNGAVEDEFYHQVAEAKDSIILKFDLAKSSAETDAVITLITGVF